MIIFGFRRSVRRLGSLRLDCPGCRGNYAMTLNKGVTKFTLFFIPLFPTRTRYALTCTWCGTTAPIGKREAESLKTQLQG
ncbi:zinc-ribbon family protein [Saccharopolyspora antimicrobica]|uniref:Zinc-ribbon family protein n=2 Tax=Saccharopolyspora antimicrobica TaxID=455193 RepID=A0A1I4WRC4_9PSEU|nr:zinc-ribbon domain-containing protein [Saccharopolyspora antimicrobica]RKT83017.1 zinc ribbon family protein [Saccharopolyspora antimicrobica]SFN15670.1 zinc-ribbon family protein [Saccharopolyspora antimicrobica]